MSAAHPLNEANGFARLQGEGAATKKPVTE
jgi:hypothetical protein